MLNVKSSNELDQNEAISQLEFLAKGVMLIWNVVCGDHFFIKRLSTSYSIGFGVAEASFSFESAFNESRLGSVFIGPRLLTIIVENFFG